VDELLCHVPVARIERTNLDWWVVPGHTEYGIPVE
jgi:hypothetical protein